MNASLQDLTAMHDPMHDPLISSRNNATSLSLNPEVLASGTLSSSCKTRQAHEGESIPDWVFNLIIGEIVQLLQNENRELEHHVNGLAPALLLRSPLCNPTPRCTRFKSARNASHSPCALRVIGRPPICVRFAVRS